MIRDDAPQPILALTRTDERGHPYNPETRVSRVADTYILDDKNLFHRLTPAGAWVWVPPFPKRPLSTPLSCGGRFATLMQQDGRPALLYSVTTPEESDEERLGICAALQPIDWADDAAIHAIEQAIHTRQLVAAHDGLTALLPQHPLDARLWFLIGAAASCSGALPRARQAFHRAMELGHPDGLQAEWAMTAAIAREFRMKHPPVNDAIERHDWHRAIQLLNDNCRDNPTIAHALIATCARHAGLDEVALHSARLSLSLDSLQSDVLGHLWSCLTLFQMDEEATATAKLRATLYPQDIGALRDLFDSALLSNDFDTAYRELHALIAHSTTATGALRYVFRYIDHTREWSKAPHYFNELLPDRPSGESLTQYGEILTELSRFDEALPHLERAMQLSPQDSDTVLAYARGLARSGDETGALRFLQTVLSDSSRTDSLDARLLMVTLLSEILCRTGRTAEAINLWPEPEAFTEELLTKVGPRPFIEFAYCLISVARIPEARLIQRLIGERFQEMHTVREFHEIMAQLDHPSDSPMHPDR